MSNGSISPFFISVQRKPQADKLPGRDSLKTILETVIQTKTRTIARALQPGPFLNCIPDDIILKWLHASIDLDRYADAMSERNFVQSSFDFLNE